MRTTHRTESITLACTPEELAFFQALALQLVGKRRGKPPHVQRALRALAMRYSDAFGLAVPTSIRRSAGGYWSALPGQNERVPCEAETLAEIAPEGLAPEYALTSRLAPTAAE